MTTTGKTDAQQSLIIVLHTSVKTMLKCVGMQNLIKIYPVVQEPRSVGLMLGKALSPFCTYPDFSMQKKERNATSLFWHTLN